MRTVFWIEFVHFNTRNSGAFFGFHCLAKLQTPCGITTFLVYFLCRFRHNFTGFTFFKFVHLLTFDALEGTHTLQHLVEVYLMTIKFRSVYTNEFGLSADGDAASTAHTCTIHHDCIQRDIGRYFIFFSQQANKFHHDGGADGKTFVHFLPFNDFFNAFGYQSFASIRAVVGHNDDLVCTFTHFFFKDNQLFTTSGKYGNNAVTGSFQSLYNREHRSYAYTTTCTNHCSEVFNMSSLSQRTYHISDIIALIQFAKAGRGEAYFLYYQSDSTAYGVSRRNCQWHTFTFFAYTYNDEVSCLT